MGGVVSGGVVLGRAAVGESMGRGIVATSFGLLLWMLVLVLGRVL